MIFGDCIHENGHCWELQSRYRIWHSNDTATVPDHAPVYGIFRCGLCGLVQHESLPQGGDAK
jgi:hypothetical protein